MNGSGYRKVISWSAADNAYLVEVPELPGCMADGTTQAEAFENAETVIQLWLETTRALGRPIPQPIQR
jgi:predicted RNase H-like HicB family nuclease